MKKFAYLLGLWIAIVQTLILSFVIPLASTGTITWGMYFSMMPLPFFLALILVSVIPLPRWGSIIASKLGTKPGTIGQQLVMSLFIVLIMSPVMSLILMWWNMRLLPNFQEIFFSAWIAALPRTFVVVYISANIALFTGKPLVTKFCLLTARDL